MQKERFARQIVLQEIGEEGQKKLATSSVLIVGCGGLGCAVFPYLAAAGIGHITLVDGDRVEISNLHRQVLFGKEDIGKYKVEVAKDAVQLKYSDISIETIPQFLDAKMALALFPKFDLIIDATDRIKMRYLISDACVLSGKPFVHAAIEKWVGQVSVFNYKNGPNYRDLYPAMNLSAPNCAEAGILGTSVSLIGSIQAQEAIKVLLSLPDVLSGQLLIFDCKTYSKKQLSFKTNGSLNLTRDQFLHDFEPKEKAPFKQVIQEKGICVDVRERHEEPKLVHENIRNIPLSTIESGELAIPQNVPIYLFCKSGMRSQKCLEILKSKGYDKVFLLQEQAAELSNLLKIYSL